jgi:hypothetical protein
MLQQALASHRVAIDRARLAERDTLPESEPESDTDPGEPRSIVAVSLPYHSADSTPQRLPVPSVTGRSVREAALALHRRGFRVSLQGLGEVVRTVPAGGEVARRGSSVTVWAQ